MKSLTRNENPLKKLDRIDKSLTIKQDQQEKQVINTIREVPHEMYTPAHLLIPPQDKSYILAVRMDGGKFELCIGEKPEM